MENTHQMLVEGDSAQWYLAVGDQWTGPHTASELLERIRRGEISWAHYVCKEGDTDWRRIREVKDFQAAVPDEPQKPAAKPKTVAGPSTAPVVKKASRKPGTTTHAEVDDRIWFLYFNDSQFGPFSFIEVSRFLKIGKIHGKVHAWRDGMKEWKRLQELPLFAEAVEESKNAYDERARKSGRPPKMSQKTSKAEKADKEAAAPEKTGFPIDKRSSPRVPLVARLLVAADDSVVAAVCRDISVGGMQVLTDKIPGIAGSRLKLNISPAGSELKPFVAEGVIVRILEDGRGFSFRFEKLGEDAKKAIEDYIRAGG